MIISRYIGKELIAATLAITLVLLVVIVSGRFVDYLADAAAGEIPAELLGFLLLYKLPGFVQLILPLGFFVALMLTYGRMYVDSEMVVLQACGMSQSKLLAAAWMPSLLVLVLVSYCSVIVAPAGEARLKTVMDNAGASAGLSSLVAGRFQYVGSGLTVYIRELSDDKSAMQGVFVVQEEPDQEEFVTSLAIAESARIRKTENNVRYLVLENGRQFRAIVNQKNRTQVRFSEFALKLDDSKQQKIRPASADALDTKVLWENPNPENTAALHWRIAMPIMMLIMMVIGFSLSHTNHRKGRYGKLLPGIVLFFFYFTGLSIFRGMVESGEVSMAVGLWPIHGAMLILAIIIFNAGFLRGCIRSSFKAIGGGAA